MAVEEEGNPGTPGKASGEKWQASAAGK